MLAFTAATVVLRGQTSGWSDSSGHAVLSVPVDSGVTLEVLDWGGNGTPLVLLSGLGNTAHVFDHLAHQFTDRFHVLGVTRRGYGVSTHPSTGYDIATRARDILAVADHLKLERIILVGHSIAGDELTKFAGTYPSRVLALVYIDAAYDRTKVAQLPQPVYPLPPADAFTSVERYTAYLARVWNWRAPEAELYNTRFVTPDGRVGDMRTPPEIPGEVIKRLEAPDYKAMRAPALALYARPDLLSVYPYSPDFDAESRARADRILAASRSYVEEAIAGFRTGTNNRRVAMLDGNHYLFFTNEAEVVRRIREFLMTTLQQSR